MLYWLNKMNDSEYEKILRENQHLKDDIRQLGAILFKDIPRLLKETEKWYNKTIAKYMENNNKE